MYRKELKMSATSYGISAHCVSSIGANFQTNQTMDNWCINIWLTWRKTCTYKCNEPTGLWCTDICHIDYTTFNGFVCLSVTTFTFFFLHSMQNFSANLIICDCFFLITEEVWANELFEKKNGNKNENCDEREWEEKNNILN